MNLKDLHTAYKEWCNCGNKASFAEYVISVGVRLDDLVLESNDADDKV